MNYDYTWMSVPHKTSMQVVPALYGFYANFQSKNIIQCNFFSLLKWLSLEPCHPQAIENPIANFFFNL